jgi:excinuclease ABC subunit B
MTNDRPQRASLWLRVSTDTKGQDPALQRADLERVCQQRGWHVVNVYEVEESAFGKKPREQFQAMLENARRGKFDVLVGVNLLREGLDLPEVSLVAILDADKEGFLRSETSLIQTIGRAARNVRGEVILYADVMTGSLKRAIEETERRRCLQIEHNKLHGITPKTIQKKIHDVFEEWHITKKNEKRKTQNGKEVLELELEADKRPVEVVIREKELQMKRAAQGLEFELAALIRDEIKLLKHKDRRI